MSTHTINGLTVTVEANVPRVRDVDLAVRLGYERPAKIRDALERDAAAQVEAETARGERDEAREALAKANASLETERIAGRVATEFWQARITTLEAAIRNLAKVLP